MSFFSKILKGLGFEEEEEKTPKKEKKVKVKEKKEKLTPNFASFDLKNEENIVENKEKIAGQELEENVEENKTEQIETSASTLDIIKVQNQVEVQKIVDKLKRDEKVIVNMLALSETDLTRSLDFLTGAVYALDKTMQKVDEAIFIIQ